MPMQMRMFREHVTGRGPMGQDSAMMRKFQMMQEGSDMPEGAQD
jgi:hypothetical protein